ncbi:gliding motility-associated ABC transporter permease subunit GldF [Bacteroidota bacterium]
MVRIYLKEINGFLNSLTGYLVVGLFLTGMGLLTWVFPETNILNYGFADMGTLFTLGPYVYMFLIPAITMRMFAEESKSGTIEMLLTQPLSDYEIIFGKFLAGFSLVVFSVLPTLIYYFSIYQLGNPVGNIDSAGVTGSYIGLILLGALFTSIGLLSSSLTENQVVAFIIAVFLCFVFYSGLQSIAAINVWGNWSALIESLGIQYHYNFMSKGLIDLKDLTFFLSVTGIMLMLTKLILSSRKW